MTKLVRQLGSGWPIWTQAQVEGQQWSDRFSIAIVKTLLHWCVINLYRSSKMGSSKNYCLKNDYSCVSRIICENQIEFGKQMLARDSNTFCVHYLKKPSANVQSARSRSNSGIPWSLCIVSVLAKSNNPSPSHHCYPFFWNLAFSWILWPRTLPHAMKGKYIGNKFQFAKPNALIAFIAI